MREIQGRRGLTDFKVVVDETNNTGEVIDRNEFVVDIFIKSTRSINFITLNFMDEVENWCRYYRSRRIRSNINDFKSRLAGGGARANQFRVILTYL